MNDSPKYVVWGVPFERYATAKRGLVLIQDETTKKLQAGVPRTRTAVDRSRVSFYYNPRNESVFLVIDGPRARTPINGQKLSRRRHAVAEAMYSVLCERFGQLDMGAFFDNDHL